MMLIGDYIMSFVGFLVGQDLVTNAILSLIMEGRLYLIMMMFQSVLEDVPKRGKLS